MSIKNTIIDPLKEENLKLHNKVKKLQEHLLEIDQNNNHLDQYSTIVRFVNQKFCYQALD